ncbi:MAG TPA: 50S ribosomal protein L6 [Candidatus Latescibacteria bacterium]|nr:50S ribosomal protein L6 [Candidatus Latescibacterota bacterium]
MSRIGKKPIRIPESVSIDIRGSDIAVKGPKGELIVPIQPELRVKSSDDIIEVICPSQDKYARSLHGLTRSLIANAVQGVSEGFEKKLELVGIGYRAEIDGGKLRISVGLSHPVILSAPEGIEFVVESATRITVKGVDKQKVGQMAARIRAFRPPEPYKGKGIKYEQEVVRRKPGKTAA